MGIGTVVLLVLIRPWHSTKPAEVTTLGSGGTTIGLPQLPYIDVAPPMSSSKEASSRGGQTVAVQTSTSTMQDPAASMSESGGSDQAVPSAKGLEANEEGEQKEEDALVKQSATKGSLGKGASKKAGSKDSVSLAASLAEPSGECHLEETTAYKGRILSQEHQDSAEACRQSCRYILKCLLFDIVTPWLWLRLTVGFEAHVCF